MSKVNFELFTVREIEGSEKKIWTKIGVLFVHESGESAKILLDALPLDREIVCLKPKVKEEQ